MNEQQITIRCACGWETRGVEALVIEATREHGRRMHNMLPTREEVLAMAVPTDDSTRAPANPS
jgi:hypothetical protein